MYYAAVIVYFLWRTIVYGYMKYGHASIPIEYNSTGIIETLAYINWIDPRNYNYVVPGGWSISIEMSFYVVFPLLFSCQARFDRKTLVWIVSLLIFMFGLIQAILIFGVGPQLKLAGIIGRLPGNNEFGYLYCSLLNQAPVFLIGILGFRYINSGVQKWTYPVAITLLVASVIIQNNHSYDTGMDGFFYPVMTAISFVMIISHISSVEIPQWIIVRRLSLIGKASFSIYLTHFMVLDVTAYFLSKLSGSPIFKLALIYSATAVGAYMISRLTNRYIEKPFIEFGRDIASAYL